MAQGAYRLEIIPEHLVAQVPLIGWPSVRGSRRGRASLAGEGGTFEPELDTRRWWGRFVYGTHYRLDSHAIIPQRERGTTCEH